MVPRADRSAPGERVTALMGRQGLVFGVAVIEGFGVTWSRVVGGPPDALFQAGSISKPVTALAALELAGVAAGRRRGGDHDGRESVAVPVPAAEGDRRGAGLDGLARIRLAAAARPDGDARVVVGLSGAGANVSRVTCHDEVSVTASLQRLA